MKKLAVYKKVFGFLTASLIFATAAASCSGKKSSNASEDSSSAIIEEDTMNSSIEADALSSKTISYSELFSQRDLDPSYDSLTADIALKGTSVEIDGDGASADGCVITIIKEGVYRFSGTLDDGQIIVNADGAKVQLVFDNADISCSYSAPVYGINSDKIFITLADGSSNSLTDASSYTYEEDTIDEPSAAIFSADSITLNGSGSLTVNANYNDGIRSKDDIVITGGTINITAVSNGIKGKDYVAAAGGYITVTSGGDGIKASNTEDQSLGFVYIEGGNFDITSEGDGIQAETVFYAVDGDFNIVSGGGSANSTKVHTDGMMGGFGGGGFGGGRRDRSDEDFGDFDPSQFFGQFDPSEFGDVDPSKMTPPDGMTPNGDPDSEASTDASPLSSGFTQLAFTADAEDSSDDDTSDSTKGIKAGTELIIEGGSYNIDSADDTLHSNGDIAISGGETSLNAGDDGIHADSQLDISGGTVSIVNSYEGIEAAIINISGGDVSVYSSDDGFNASDGSSQGAMGTYASGVELNISGGLVYVNASGDGLDSNGDMTISGGTVIVDGPTNDGNGALDGNNSIIVTGGTIVAAGSSGMAEYPDSDSAQNSVSCTFDETYEGGTLVVLLDEDGEEIICFTPAKSFNNIVISSPDIETGKTYTFYTGGTVDGEGANKYLSSGYNDDGEEAGSFTVSDVTSFVGTQANIMGGGGFGGGMQGGNMPSDGFSGGEPPEMPTGGADGEPPEMPDGGGFGGRSGFGQSSN